jgi:hypothetical protein
MIEHFVEQGNSYTLKCHYERAVKANFKNIHKHAVFCERHSIAAGLFLYKTSDDKPLAYGVLIGSLLFAGFAYAMAQIYPVAG